MQASSGGRIVTEPLPFDGGRRVTAYLPEERAEAVVFAADGGEVASWDSLRETDGVAPTATVGVHGLADETRRLVAGTQEPFFVDNARRWALALQDAGGEVMFAERDAGHEPGLWKAELPRMVAWAFG